MPLKLHVIVCSTRPGRVGRMVGDWFHEVARADGGFDVELVDLAEVALPLYDEPRHPRLAEYEHESTRRWSAIVDAADAYVFVTPEYNYATPPALVNALDLVYREWAYKPAAFVSYGGVSGGLRGVQMSKQIVTSLRMMPIPETVSIAMIAQQIADGALKPTEQHRTGAAALLAELRRWAEALKPMRAPVRRSAG